MFAPFILLVLLNVSPSNTYDPDSLSIEQRIRFKPDHHGTTITHLHSNELHVIEPRLETLPPPPPPHAIDHDHPPPHPPTYGAPPPPPPAYHPPPPPPPPAYHPPKPSYHGEIVAPHHLPLEKLPPPHPPHHTPLPHPYQSVPECAYNAEHNYNATFCLVDEYYPVDTIKFEISRNLPIIDRVLTDVSYQSADNLVDGLTKYEEETYTYSHYYGDHIGQDHGNYRYSPEYYHKGGYICPSDIYYGRPKRAINTYGEWKVIVNLPEEYLAKGYGPEFARFSQTQRLEQCLYPTFPCSYIHPSIPSSCLQKYTFVRMLAYTRHEGLHMDSFKLPASCSCHVGDHTYFPYGYN